LLSVTTTVEHYQNTAVISLPLPYSGSVITVTTRLLGERCYVTFALCHEPSVCRLSVTFVRHAERVELFRFFAPPNRIQSGERAS